MKQLKKWRNSRKSLKINSRKSLKINSRKSLKSNSRKSLIKKHNNYLKNKYGGADAAELDAPKQCEYKSDKGRQCKREPIINKKHCIHHSCKIESCEQPTSSRNNFCKLHQKIYKLNTPNSRPKGISYIECCNGRLGEGTFGVVEQGKMFVGKTTTPVAIAIKIPIFPNETGDEDSLEYKLWDQCKKEAEATQIDLDTCLESTRNTIRVDFEREYEILALLQENEPHKNLVKFIGGSLGFPSPTPYRIMIELCEFGDLLKKIKTNPEMSGNKYNLYINENSNIDYLQILKDIAEGMEYISSKNIVHRDLAARNVLLANEDRTVIAKISDFGLSQVMSEEDDTMQWKDEGVGQRPPRWCPLEVLNNGLFTEKSDVWSYAVLIFELFNKGAVPYDGHNFTQIISVANSDANSYDDDDKKSKFYADHLGLNWRPSQLKELIKKCFLGYNNRCNFSTINTDLKAIVKLYNIGVDYRTSESISKQPGAVDYRNSASTSNPPGAAVYAAAAQIPTTVRGYDLRSQVDDYDV